jgi:hypothetical protein
MKAWLTKLPMRRIALSCAALILFTTIVIGREDDPDVVTASDPKQTNGAAPLGNGKSASIALNLERLNRAKAGPGENDIFAARSWRPAPPPIPVKAIEPPSTPPAPTAPPLPFKYIGNMQNGKTQVVFVAKNDQDYSVRIGDTIDNTYRLDEMSANMITFTYLPLNEKQTLAVPPRN